MPDPADPDIRQRDIAFDIGRDLPRHWHSGCAHITHYYNALSILFPEGERSFIRSVRAHAKFVSDPVLQAQVQGFIAQEAMHGREHQRYNDALQAQGYPAKKMEARLGRFIAFFEKLLPARHMLASTICLEHFTAILAHQMLANPQLMAGATPAMQRLWRWHALEETEHKAVAYDVWNAVYEGKPVRSWLMRSYFMLVITLDFSAQTIWNHLVLLRHDRQLSNLRGWLRLLRYLWLSPGPLLRMLPSWLAWFRPGFHPWQHDNRVLIARWRKDYDAADSGFSEPA